MAAPCALMDRMTDYFPYENSAPLDAERRLVWSNAAILHALTYCEAVCGVSLEYEQILDELRDGRLRAIQALLYGAAKTADERLTIKRYGYIYRTNNLTQYVAAVLDGMSHYLPPPTVADNEENLDPDWPDTQAEARKKGLRIDWGYWIHFCNKIGREFRGQTMRSMLALQRLWLKEQGIEIDDSGESDL